MEWHRGGPHFVLSLLVLAIPLDFAEGGESPRMRDVRGHHCLCLIEEVFLSESGFSYASDLPYFNSSDSSSIAEFQPRELRNRPRSHVAPYVPWSHGCARIHEALKARSLEAGICMLDGSRPARLVAHVQLRGDEGWMEGAWPVP